MGLSPGAKPEELKKAFRDISVKKHPDRGGSAEEYSKITEAFHLLEKQGTSQDVFAGSPGQSVRYRRVNHDVDIGDLFSHMRANFGTTFNVEFREEKTPIIELTIEELATGVEKDISIPYKKENVNVRVNIPAGMTVGSILTIKYKEQAILAVIGLKPDKELNLQGNDVISNIHISLLEALMGTKKEVRTAHGIKTLVLKPGTKNQDVLRGPGLGIPIGTGSHRFIVNVNYPDNVDELISFLSKTDVAKPKRKVWRKKREKK